MIQPILFFALGALSLGLLVLLAAPGFRRSAERAARRKLEAALPMSMNEIQAGRDALRAEFAAATQRFEHEARAVRSERDEQAIASGRVAEQLRLAQADGAALRETVAALEGERTALRASLDAAGEAAKGLEAQVAAQEELMDEARLEAGRLERRFEEASFLASSRQIELVARESDAERLADEFQATRGRLGALEKELNAVRSAAHASQSRESETEAKTHLLSIEMASAEARIAQGEADIERMRAEAQAAAARRRQLEAELAEARKERLDLEAEFAGLNRLLVGLFPAAAAGGSPAKALEAAAAERDRLEARAAALLRETRDLRTALAQAQGAFPEASAEAELREQILSLAAQVAALTAGLEGPGGPLDKALASGGSDPSAPSPSLAERIRALCVARLQERSVSSAK